MDTKTYTLSTGTILTSTELYEAHRIAESSYNREDVEIYIDWEDSTFASIPEEVREDFINNATVFYNEAKGENCDCWVYDLDYAISEALEKFANK